MPMKPLTWSSSSSRAHTIAMRDMVPLPIHRFAPSPPAQPAADALDQLTERELEVLQLAARGLRNQEIALELSLSVRTVQTHLSNIFSKMRVGSRTEAVLEALRRGWIALPDTLARGD